MRGKKIKVEAKITIPFSKGIFKKGDKLIIQSILRDKDLVFTRHEITENGLVVKKTTEGKKGDYLRSVIITEDGKEYDSTFLCQNKSLGEVFNKL